MIEALLVVLISCAAPWAFGAVEPSWWALASAASLTVASVALVAAAIRGEAPAFVPPRAKRLAAALVAVALLGFVPIPFWLRSIVSPAGARVLDDAAGPGVSWRTISLDPQSTLGAAIVAGACAAVFWLVARACATESRTRTIAAVLLAGGAALAGFGLVQRLWHYDPQAIYWTVRLPDVSTPFGPYVNRNHFAGAMELFAGIAAGFALWSAASRRWVVFATATAVLTLVAVALVATTSRGGFIGAAAAAAFLIAASRRASRLRLLIGILVVTGVAAALMLEFGLLRDLTDRFHLTPVGRERNRFKVMWDAVQVFGGSPVFGTGAGTFAVVYPPFQTVEDVRHFNNAHSDWAQFLMETGLVGVAFVAAALRETSRALRRAATSETPARWLSLGPAAGCFAVCVQGFFEVNLHVPANALLFAATLSLAYATAVRDSP